MAIVVYTCIVNNYDTPIMQPKFDGVDYIIYSDSPKFYENYCDKSLPLKRNDLDYTRINRYHKIMYHKLEELQKYKYSIYLDGNIKIINDVRNIEFKDFMIYRHPHRNCVYEEAQTCIKFRKDDKEIINKQMERYTQEGMPKNYGLNCGGILFRKYDKNIIKIMEKWWREVENGSKRDQLSLMYILWKLNFTILMDLFGNTFNYFSFKKKFKHK